MTSRYPLTLNVSSSTIEELPAAVNLDLTGSNISNVGNIAAGNSISANYFVGTLYGTANIANIAYSVDGANVTGTVANATYAANAGNANFANSATVANSANSVTGANVSGEVAFANVANNVAGSNVSGQVGNALIAGTVYTNAQPNITSVGNLANLTVTGTSTLGNIGNVKITGGSNTQVIQTDGAGNLSFATIAAASFMLRPVRVATIDNITVSGLISVDGITVSNGDRVLVKSQINATQNGIYLASSGSWTRATDFTTGSETLIGGISVAVQAGTFNNGTSWQCTNTSAITIGSTSITFVQQGINRLIASAGLSSSESPATGTGLSIGFGAGTTTNSLAVGANAVANTTGFATAIGTNSRANNLGSTALGVASNASGFRAVAIGGAAISSNEQSLAIGYDLISSGNRSVAIGSLSNASANNSIIINATGSALNQTTANTFTVKPVREINNLSSSVLDYNTTTGEISSHLRTFGSFTSNATQTSNGANTTNYMTLNNTEDANGISIASSTRLTVARVGRYNIQFSAQLEKTDLGTDIIEIWLDKNGNSVANSATQIELRGNNAKEVAAWDFNVNAANVNDYFRIAWASPDANVQLTAITAANTISGVALPSVIVNINPIGA